MDLKGKSFVLTGKSRDYSRADLKEALQKRGAKVSGSLSAKTDAIVALGTNSSTDSKLQKAKDLGTLIFSERLELKAIMKLKPGQDLDLANLYGEAIRAYCKSRRAFDWHHVQVLLKKLQPFEEYTSARDAVVSTVSQWPAPLTRSRTPCKDGPQDPSFYFDVYMSTLPKESFQYRLLEKTRVLLDDPSIHFFDVWVGPPVTNAQIKQAVRRFKQEIPSDAVAFYRASSGLRLAFGSEKNERLVGEYKDRNSLNNQLMNDSFRDFHYHPHYNGFYNFLRFDDVFAATTPAFLHEAQSAASCGMHIKPFQQRGTTYASFCFSPAPKEQVAGKQLPYPLWFLGEGNDFGAYDRLQFTSFAQYLERVLELPLHTGDEEDFFSVEDAYSGTYSHYGFIDDCVAFEDAKWKELYQQFEVPMTLMVPTADALRSQYLAL
jgi:hypothetical protein